MNANESNPAVVIVYLVLAMLITLGVALAIFFATVGWPSPDTFDQDCRDQNGHVYTMDADHRVCLRNGKVVAR